jgi:hypothetical protein
VNELTYLPVLPDTIQELDCCVNQLEYLPVLPKKIKVLDCSINRLYDFPDLPDNIRGLFCSSNQLISLSNLPHSLNCLNCSNNQLTRLPRLPDKIELVKCDNNQLSCLPDLPDTLLALHCQNNYRMDYTLYGDLDDDLSTIKRKTKILNRFKYIYYLIRFKRRFRDFLWFKVREPRIKEQFHPKHLSRYKDNDKKNEECSEDEINMIWN